MIERYDGMIEMVCDGCGEVRGPVPSNEFEELVAEAKTEGWLLRKEDDEWQHNCRDCR